MPSSAPVAKALSQMAWPGSVMLLLCGRSFHGHLIAGKAQISMLCYCSNVSLRMTAGASSHARNSAVTPKRDCAGHAATHEQGGKDGSAAEAGAGPCLESGAPNVALIHCSISDARCVVDIFMLRARCWKQLCLLKQVSAAQSLLCTQETAAARRHTHRPHW